MSCSLSYTLTGITGDCGNTNSGSFGIEIQGTAPDYTIQWLTPITDNIPLGVGVTAYTVTNLSAGTYTFNILDSCLTPENTVFPVSIYISSGVCTSITSFNDTLCGLDNGSITATTEYDYGSNTFYLYHNTLGYIKSGTTTNSITPPGVIFNSLSAGTYYVKVTDGGGCSGETSSVIIKESSELDFGIYVVNDAGCNVNSGKLFVTGLTGNPPYTYLWSNGATTDSIEDLISGDYSVTVTDNTGCGITKAATITKVPQVGQSGVIVSQPSCFASDGKITLFVSGGTAPYYFSGSNGTFFVTFSNFYEFDNLPGGVFSYFIQDSALCSFNGSTTLITPSSFNIVSITTTNTKCFDNSGKISIAISSGTPPYIYKLKLPNGTETSISTTYPNYDFSSLVPGTYTLTISDGGGCQYVRNYDILNDTSFVINTDVTGTTCGNNNGIVKVDIIAGVGPYLYEIDGQSVVSNSITQTFFNLSSGIHSLSVSDTSIPCKQTTTVFVDESFGVEFITNPQNPTGSNNGQIQVFITSGQPPFTYEWSNNVGGQTGLLITNLSAGTYTVKITDDNGCVNEKTIILRGINCSVSYEVYNFSEEVFKNTGELIKKGPLQMLNEGFNDLTLGDDNCILNQAIFEAYVSVSGVSATTQFYTGNTLFDVPSDTLWSTTIRNLLLSFEGIGNVTINTSTNKITITTDCNSEVSLLDSDILINMIIHYDVSCVSCALSCDYPKTGVCDGYKLTETMTVNSVLDPSEEILELYDGGYGPGSNHDLTWRIVPITVNVTSGCLNSDPDANVMLRNAAMKAKNELALATGPFNWANNFLPSFQINKFF